MWPASLKCGEVIPFGAFSGVVDHWISQRAAGKVGSADLPHLDRGPWRLSTPERRPSQLDPGNSDRTVDCGRCARRSWVSRQTSLLWSLCTLPPASACACRCPLSPSRCPLSATINRSASKERHKLLFLHLSTKLNTMSEKSRPTFPGHSSQVSMGP